MKFPFTREDYRHDLVQRQGMVSLVRRTSTHAMSKGSEHYEVVRLREDPARVIEGRQLPAGERYPGPGDWGWLGWTYTTLADAQSRFDSQTALGSTPDAPAATEAQNE